MSDYVQKWAKFMCCDAEMRCLSMSNRDPPIRMFAGLHRHYNPKHKPPPTTTINTGCAQYIGIVCQLLFILERPTLYFVYYNLHQSKEHYKTDLERSLPPPLH